MERKQRTFLRKVRARALALSVAAALGIGLIAGCHGGSASDYLSAGDAAMQKGQLPQAGQNYQAAAKAAPNDPRVHVALGNLYLFEQKPTLAQPEFMKVLELEPANAVAHSALGEIYESQSQMGAAEEQYRAAVALKPADPAYRLQLGSLLAKVNKLIWAESEIRTAIGLQPKNARAHLALANVLSAIPSAKTEADAEYAEARALDPHLMAPTPPVAGTPAPAAPAANPAEAAAVPAPAAPGGKRAKLKPLNRKFKLTKDSAVYQQPDGSTTAVGQVHRGHFVHVTGIQGNWLQVTLHNGTVGFIPVSAAE
ncbi:MAG TPA: tetratricopeptide repeat protein [Candidatus Binataceae bacterium]|nr:tetratricopeptide repeat protein [Candidatus Binataceae bacterium]